MTEVAVTELPGLVVGGRVLTAGSVVDVGTVGSKVAELTATAATNAPTAAMPSHARPLMSSAPSRGVAGHHLWHGESHGHGGGRRSVWPPSRPR